MKSAIFDRFSSEEISVFESVSLSVSSLPDMDLGLDHNENEVVLSCHVLARACSKVFGLPFFDGRYHPAFAHSWLLTNEKNFIDVYPVGAVISGNIQPVMIDSTVARHFFFENQPGETLLDEETGHAIWGQDTFEKSHRLDKSWFSRSVDQVVDELRKALGN